MEKEFDKLLLHNLIDNNSLLFWWIPENKKHDLPVESLVEAILNYGNSKSVKELFMVCGIKQV